MVNTCNYRGDREGGINAEFFIPQSALTGIICIFDTEGVLSGMFMLIYFLGQEDLNNVDMNSISPLYEIMLD